MRMSHLFLTLLLLFNLLPMRSAHAQRPIVRCIYFLPSDRQPQPDINTKLNALMKDVQKFFADEMERHGFGRKTFRLETDTHGRLAVHRVNGGFTDEYYHFGTHGKVKDEINRRFDMSKNLYFVAIDISSEKGFEHAGRKVCGLGGDYVPIVASDHCITGKYGFVVAAHELGHTFGLQHDFRDDSYLMSYGLLINDQLSKCAAEWLNVHRVFNSSRVVSNDKPATIEMLPPNPVSPANAIRLRFKVTDPDGLQQAQLQTKTLSGLAAGFLELLNCKSLNGKSRTVEFITMLMPKNKFVSVAVIDVHGNFRRSRGFRSMLPHCCLPPKSFQYRMQI